MAITINICHFSLLWPFLFSPACGACASLWVWGLIATTHQNDAINLCYIKKKKLLYFQNLSLLYMFSLYECAIKGQRMLIFIRFISSFWIESWETPARAWFSVRLQHEHHQSVRLNSVLYLWCNAKMVITDWGQTAPRSTYEMATRHDTPSG